jgi:transposase-like protein
MSQLLVQATDHLAKQENDIKFLLDKVESSQGYSRLLEKKVEILESQLINNTMHTWS